jgi:iron complex transport system substrate-binding protein
MTLIRRRRALAGALALLTSALLPSLSMAASVTDSAGRRVELPDTVTRVFAAGPPATAMLYVLAPQLMAGWVRLPTEAEKPFLLAATRNLPQLGRVTGRGGSLNLEGLIADHPSLVFDFGTINDTYRSLANNVQSQTGIPYLLIDGRFANTPAALRLMGTILGVGPRGEQLATAAEAILADVDRVLAAVPADRRPRVYLARGAEGLETGSRGSINTEIIERAGAINVVEGLRDKGGLVTASPEQLIAWAPDTIITLDPRFLATVKANPVWQSVPAVKSGRVFLAPGLPFGFIDAPPSVNRLVGLTWLLHVLYPAQAPGELRDQVRDFYRLFYQVDPTDAQLDQLLKPADG